MIGAAGNSKEAEVQAFAIIFVPFWICDLPLSAVADTLVWPFDAFSNNSTNTP